jgi:hypothetical protein
MKYKDVWVVKLIIALDSLVTLIQSKQGDIDVNINDDIIDTDTYRNALKILKR